MPPFSSLVTLLLAILLLGEAHASAPHVAAPSLQETSPSQEAFPSQEASPPVPHTPSTLHWGMGDTRNARFTLMQRSVGLIHTHSAQTGSPGVFHLSLLASYSHAKNFPKLPRSDIGYANVNRWMGTFSAAYVFLPWLEAYASYEVSSSFATMHSSPNNSSDVSGQILGDTRLGAKFSHGFAPSFYAGLDLGLRLFNVSQSMSHLRLAFLPSLLLTWNVQELTSRIPLVLHSNFGLHVGRYTRLFSEQPAKAMWQTFSWNLNSRHYAFLNFALEAPLPYATPFVEYRASLPFWRKADKELAKAPPQSLVVGAKLTMLPNLTFFLGGEFNIKSPLAPGIALHPPWRFFLGLSLATAPSSSVPTPQKLVPALPVIETHVEELPAAAPTPAQLLLALRRGNKLVPGQVYLRGPNPQHFHITEEAPAFSLPPGPLLLEILPEEGLAQVQKVDLASGQTQALLLRIESAPATAPVRLVNQRIVLAEPLAFAPNNVELTAHGQTQLRGLVDFLIRNHIQKIRIESHVEAQKTEGSAMEVSAQRAQSVVEALVGLGIDAERIEILNLGDSRPVAPNIRRGRLLNRRMDFIVVEKWE